MIQRDYVLRQIHQLVHALAQALFFRRQQRYAEALDVVQHSGEQFLGLDTGGLRTVTYAELVAVLQARSLHESEHAVYAAEMLQQKAELHALQQEPEAAAHAAALALALYLDLWSRADTQALDLPERIEALLLQVDRFTLPRDVLALLMRYYEAQGQLAKAEDVLFVLAETPDAALHEAGRAFYERLRRMTNARLRAGGLSREEVAEGLDDFLDRVPAPRPER